MLIAGVTKVSPNSKVMPISFSNSAAAVSGAPEKVTEIGSDVMVCLNKAAHVKPEIILSPTEHHPAAVLSEDKYRLKIRS